MSVQRAYSVGLIFIGVVCLFVAAQARLGSVDIHERVGIVESASCERRGRVSLLTACARAGSILDRYGTVSHACRLYGDTSHLVGRNITVSFEASDNDIYGLVVDAVEFLSRSESFITSSVVGALIGVAALAGCGVLGRRPGLFSRHRSDA